MRCGPRLLSVWQPQYLEPPERVAARLVAVHRGSCLCGGRSTWSLQKGLRRAWSPSATAPVCVAQYLEPPERVAARLVAVGRQAQYSEPLQRVAARLVAVGRGSYLCGRPGTWSLQKGLRRAWSLWAAAPVCVASAVLGTSRKGCGAPGRRGPRLLSVWQTQYSEPLERVWQLAVCKSLCCV